MLAYVGLSCGQCGPILCILWLCWPHVEACWAKRSEKWEQQKKHCKTQDILMVGGLSWGYVGLSVLVHLGAILAHLGGYVGRSWGYVGPSWGYLGPSWGPCWPILGAMLAHLEAYVGPCWPILSDKIRKSGKMGRARNTVKRGTFWPDGVGRRLGRRPLSPTERRELPYGKDTARGPLAGFKRLPRQPARGPTMLAYVGLCWGRRNPKIVPRKCLT